jgi:RNA polymerase sigma-70 factor (ECF subfamily)
MLAEEGAAIEVVFADHFARLERQLTSITRDPDDGQELAAEAFARFSREIAAGKVPANPEAWLRRVGNNLAWSRGRRMAVARRRLAQMTAVPDPAAPETLVIMAETWSELARVIDELAPAERDALMLAARGYDSAEIGAALGRTSGAARTLLCRARAKLRGQLEATGFVVGSLVVQLTADDSPINVLFG